MEAGKASAAAKPIADGMVVRNALWRTGRLPKPATSQVPPQETNASRSVVPSDLFDENVTPQTFLTGCSDGHGAVLQRVT